MVMGGDDERSVRLMIMDEPCGVLCIRLIQSREGLIQQEDRRRMREGSCQLNSAALTARERRDGLALK